MGRVVRYARKLGIRSELEPNLSLALGASAVSLLELTEAYAIFAAGGRRVEPVFIRRVAGPPTATSCWAPVKLDEGLASNGDGTPAVGSGADRALAALDGEANQVIPPAEAYLATDLLRGVVDLPRGTGRRARSLGRPVAGKTGTTNEQGDAWFVGFSPDVVTGAWVGTRRAPGPGSGRDRRPRRPADLARAFMERRPGRTGQGEALPGTRGHRVRPHRRQDGCRSPPAASEEVRFQAFAEGTAPTADRGRRPPRPPSGAIDCAWTSKPWSRASKRLQRHGRPWASSPPRSPTRSAIPWSR